MRVRFDMTKKQFTLYTQLPKVKKIGVGVLSIYNKDVAQFLNSGEENAEILAILKDPVINFAGPDGFVLRGYESVFSKSGAEKFMRQEWFLNYTV